MEKIMDTSQTDALIRRDGKELGFIEIKPLKEE
jgi:hypothetical protein